MTTAVVDTDTETDYLIYDTSHIADVFDSQYSRYSNNSQTGLQCLFFFFLCLFYILLYVYFFFYDYYKYSDE